jgi:signal transduction histidine kinase
MKSNWILGVSLHPGGEDCQISFSDTGPGSNPQLIEKIFEPFQSQFEGGTGLGLAIVYQIVQAHEGKVWARSKPGQGSVFVLRLRRLAVDENAFPATGKIVHKALNPAGTSVSAASAGGRAHG